MTSTRYESPSLQSSKPAPTLVLILLATSMLFIIGYSVSLNRISPEYLTAYSVLMIINLSSVLLLIAAFQRHDFITNMPYGIMLILFLFAYFIKYWWILVNPKSASYLPVTRQAVYLDWVQFQTIELTTIGFVTFCLTAFLVLLILPSRSQKVEVPQEPILQKNWEQLAKVLSLIVPVLIILVMIPVMRFNVGVLGVRPVNLPFRLTGIIFYTFTITMPALQLLLFHAARQSGNRFLLGFSLSLIGFTGIASGILIASRGSFLFSMLPVIFLSLMYQKYRRQVVILTITTIIVSAMLFSFITVFRENIVANYGDHGQAISNLNFEGMWRNSTDFFNELLNGTRKVVFRIIGTDSLFALVVTLVRPIGIEKYFFDGIQPTIFFTNDVLGYPRMAVHNSAPSFFGWFYLLLGKWGMAVGVALITIFIGLGWRILQLLALKGWLVLPVIQAMVLSRIVSLASDGGFESLFVNVLAIAFTLIFLEWFIRLYLWKDQSVKTQWSS